MEGSAATDRIEGLILKWDIQCGSIGEFNIVYAELLGLCAADIKQILCDV